MLCLLRNEGVPSFRLCASFALWKVQNVERRACTTFVSESWPRLEGVVSSFFSGVRGFFKFPIIALEWFEQSVNLDLSFRKRFWGAVRLSRKQRETGSPLAYRVLERPLRTDPRTTRLSTKQSTRRFPRPRSTSPQMRLMRASNSRRLIC